MFDFNFSFSLDLLIVVLLIIAIVYAIVLDHHLSVTKDNYRGLSRLVEQFYQAASKTQNELINLKNQQEKVRQSLHEENEKALLLEARLADLMDKIDKKLLLYPSAQPQEKKPMTLAELTLSLKKQKNQSEQEEELLFALTDLK